MLPKNDERPPFFAFAVSLYRSDLLFRGLVDLAVSGLAILVFTGGLAAAWQPVKSAVNSLVGAAPSDDQRDSRQRTNPVHSNNAAPGAKQSWAIQAPQYS